MKKERSLAKHKRTIDALIPVAMEKARKNVEKIPPGRRILSLPSGRPNGDRYNHYMETQFFHEEMDRLKRNMGLIA